MFDARKLYRPAFCLAAPVGFLLALAPHTLLAQTPVTGQAALTQSVAASGTAANPVQSFTATGSITYYWAGKPVQGTATIRAKGATQFRLDAVLPAGTRSFVVTGSGGNLKETDGKLTAIPLHNTLTFGVPSFPYPSRAYRIQFGVAQCLPQMGSA